MKRLLKRLPRRGQAMFEYSFTSHALLVGAAIGGWPFLTAMIKALSQYYESIYFVLTSPVP